MEFYNYNTQWSFTVAVDQVGVIRMMLWLCACMSFIVILSGTARQWQPLDISVRNHQDFLRRKDECRMDVSSMKEGSRNICKKCCISNTVEV